MRKKILVALMVFFSLANVLKAEEPSAFVQPQILGGDAGVACQVILCLAAVGSPPSECAKPLARYFAIKFKKPWKTANARKAFLALCPKQ